MEIDAHHMLRTVKKFLLTTVTLLLVAVAELFGQTYYVATTGSDSSDGSFDHPFRTIPKGISVATVPGTTIYVRGGTYAYSSTITISRSGNASSRYQLLAYPGERVFLDFSSMPINSNNRGIRLSGSYWYIKGFDIWKAGDNGMNVSGSNNIIEFCSFSENNDTGLQLGSGASNNQIINCDSYYNADPGQGNADGFSPKLDVGTGNYFYGCRSWQNSDDGWDGYIRPRPAVVPTTTLENCWSFMNGYLKTGLPSSGNGNGFKMGGSDSANLSHNMILRKCLSFQNRVKGFDQNNDRGSMTLLNCTAFSNGTNYGMNGPIGTGSVMTLKNCISAGTGAVNLLSTAVLATNSWMPPFVVTNDDFISVDTTGMRGPRQADGSLPDVPFMHLAAGNDLIDAGTDVGLPFNGPAPDLGCFESEVTTIVVRIPIVTGWNMISCPVAAPVPDDSAKHLFPTITGRVFEFAGGYVAEDTMGHGKGYWGNFPAATPDSITGMPRARDSVVVADGWNLIGSISSPVDTGAIISVPTGLRTSTWFGWSGGGYEAVSRIVPGQAYWVKTNGAGIFVLASPVSALPAPTRRRK